MSVENHLTKLEQALASGAFEERPRAPGVAGATARRDSAAQARAAAVLGKVISVSGAQVLAHAPLDSYAATDGDELSVGAYVGIRTARTLAIGVVCEITSIASPGVEPTHASTRIDLLGELVTDDSGKRFFRRGVSRYPKVGSAIVAIEESELRLIFDVAAASTINIGHLQQNASVGAYVDVDEMVQRHFAVFGSTGSGKSSTVALILREIMAAQMDLRILLIDPHNEYTRSFDDKAHVVRPENLRLPFWLFSFDEIVAIIFGRWTEASDEIGLLAELIPVAKSEFARTAGGTRNSYSQVEPDGGRYSIDTPVPYRMEDLIGLADSRMGKLENRAVAGIYQKLVTRLNAVRKNTRFAFIFDDTNLGHDPMVDILCQLLRLQDNARSITIVQLAGFPAEVFDSIVAALFRIAFEFGIWSDGSIPLLVVCEEAHQYANSDQRVGFTPARQALTRIAKEGRKHGVFLGLVTQRPAQIDPTLVSQCSTVFAMRMGDEADQKIVRAAVSDPSDRLLGFLPALGPREALAFGAGVPVATRLCFKELPQAAIPRSEAVWGGRMDASGVIDRKVVSQVVARWRGQAAAPKVHAERPIVDWGLTPR